MSDKKSYPEEIFEWRLKKYKVGKRTKLPCQVESEACQRVNKLVNNKMPSSKVHK